MSTCRMGKWFYGYYITEKDLLLSCVFRYQDRKPFTHLILYLISTPHSSYIPDGRWVHGFISLTLIIVYNREYLLN
jgi:hypothetical protein